MFPSARITMLRDVLPKVRQGAAFDAQKAWDACYAWFFQRPGRFHSGHLLRMQQQTMQRPREMTPEENKHFSNFSWDNKGRMLIANTLVQWFGEPRERRVANMPPERRVSCGN